MHEHGVMPLTPLARRGPGEREICETCGLEGLGGSAGAAAVTSEAWINERRGLRVALLTLAAAILLLGAAIAGVFGYHAIGNGSAAAAGSPVYRLSVR